MKKIILYISPFNKKVLYTQFHVEAENLQQAILNLEKITSEKFRIIGMTEYPESNGKNFVNNKFI